VLLVEDHADGREMLRLVMADAGHEVDAVPDAATARARMARECPYDVLLTDLGLPDGGGWELVRDARGRWPELRIGVITGWEPDAFRDVVPAHFSLRKPVRTRELLALVSAPHDA
jgi:DNA-binding response OmpR family regulator